MDHTSSSDHELKSTRLTLALTADGSHTLFDSQTGEHYHSLGGAVTESSHVFILMGLQPVLATNFIFHVYEIGMGTGLNTLLTCIEATKSSKHVHYHTCELFPISETLAHQLNYPQLLDHPQAQHHFRAIHNTEWDGKPYRINNHFVISKHRCSLHEMKFAEQQLRLVYFDAFSSGSQPELWSPEVFKNIANWLLPGGVLVTYSTAGKVKKALRESGFVVGRHPGAAGKREMLKAIKP